MLLLVLAAIFAAFTLSASAGFGGSLILVPALSLMLGVKKGVAVAALLLAGNNVAKAVAYRSTIPWRASAAVVVLTLLGSLLGAAALVAAPERLVAVAVAAGIVAALVVEPTQPRLRRAAAPLLAFGAGAASGFSGTSGPLKGTALRSLGMDRSHFVAAASIVSLAGDATKSLVYSGASLLDGAWMLVLASLPLMLAGTLVGRMINQRVGEAAFTVLFWIVMGGYLARLLV